MLETSSDRIKPTFVDTILPLEQSEDTKARKAAVAAKLNTKISQIVELRLLKHSIDARQRKIKVQLRLEVGVDELLAPEPELQFKYLTVSPDANNVLIVGCGPAGLFAALRCLELGLKPMILERGKDASSRRFDLGPILKEGRVIEDSNYCFGEGAGFAGGIVSAALDGMRCAEAAAESRGYTSQDRQTLASKTTPLHK